MALISNQRGSVKRLTASSRAARDSGCQGEFKEREGQEKGRVLWLKAVLSFWMSALLPDRR